MIELTMYQCEVCLDKFCDENDAKICEERHLHKPVIEDLDYRKGCMYPRYIIVRFENGKTIQYSNISIVTSGDPEDDHR